jgi:PEGA domain
MDWHRRTGEAVKKGYLVAIHKLARLWPASRRGRGAANAAAAAEPDWLDAFSSEQDGRFSRRFSRTAKGGLALVPAPISVAVRRNWRVLLTGATVVLAAAAVAAAGVWVARRAVADPPSTSQLTVETTPPGLEVAVGGEPKGRTPLTLDLAPGTYRVQVGRGAQRREIEATLVAGRSLVERLEVPAAATGSLRVETEPSRLAVVVDGKAGGTSPLLVSDLAPGKHEVVIRREGGPVRRSVTVRANETVSLIVSVSPKPERPASSAGYLVVETPLVLQLRLDGDVVGSTDLDRLMLPAGDHVVELVNDELGFRGQRRVSIAPGKTTRLSVDAPEGRVSINAQPWAEVWLDGRRLGVTPIGNVETTIGVHEIVFRHPELGERRTKVAVGMREPARVGMDMRTK